MNYVIQKSDDGWSRFLARRGTSIITIGKNIEWDTPQFDRVLAHELWHYQQWKWCWKRAEKRKPSFPCSLLRRYNVFNEAKKIFNRKEKETAAYGESLREIAYNQKPADVALSDYEFFWTERDRYVKSLLEDGPYAKQYGNLSREQLTDRIMHCFHTKALFYGD